MNDVGLGSAHDLQELVRLADEVRTAKRARRPRGRELPERPGEVTLGRCCDTDSPAAGGLIACKLQDRLGATAVARLRDMQHSECGSTSGAGIADHDRY